MKPLIDPPAIVRSAADVRIRAQQIRTGHQTIRRHGEESVRVAIEVGRLLDEDWERLKESHGLTAFLKQCELPRQTARDYRTIYLERDICTTVVHMGVAGVLNFLRTGKTGEEDDADDAEETDSTPAAPESPHVARNTGNPEWYTPPEYLEAARAVLGHIDLDPASSEIAQRTVKADAYHTAADDGLAKEWTGNVWLNPPYSAELVGKFTAKLCGHFKAGDVTAALLLVNNATETQWFQDAAAHSSAVCFPAGRVRFLDEEGNPGAPLQGQAVLYFGGDAGAFVEAFKDFGFCVRAEA